LSDRSGTSRCQRVRDRLVQLVVGEHCQVRMQSYQQRQRHPNDGTSLISMTDVGLSLR